jgi:hypothetical protein
VKLRIRIGSWASPSRLGKQSRFRNLAKNPISELTINCSIVDAYQQRIYEIELERMSDGYYAKGATGTVFDESIEILSAAKKQLLGY